MAYGTANVDNIQSSTAGTPVVFKDGGGTQIGTLCRAWVNFNGTGTPAIRGSFNVSSITDNGTGLYTLNFTTALPDTNYVGVGCAGTLDTANGYVTQPTPLSTNTFKFTTVNGGGTATVDYQQVHIAIFR